jgi:hypothetical protein
MEAGTTTVRPTELAKALLERMGNEASRRRLDNEERKHGVQTATEL